MAETTRAPAEHDSLVLFRDEYMLQVYRAKLDFIPARTGKAHFHQELTEIFMATAIPPPALYLSTYDTERIHRWRQFGLQNEAWMRDMAHKLAEGIFIALNCRVLC